MTIDWLTVGAQVVNFLVLVYLLKRFLYGPIVRAMARREETIAEQQRQAQQRIDEAEAEARRHREAREAVESQRERQLARAREEADDLRRALEKDLQRDIDERREHWRTEIEREQDAFLRDVRRQVGEQFEILARLALADLASTELETQVARVLIERLGGLDTERREALAAMDGPVRVRSAFELPAAVKRSLTAALHETLGSAVEVSYEPAADVVCGVEIRSGGESLAWSLAGHLDALEHRLREGLQPAPGARAREGPA